MFTRYRPESLLGFNSYHLRLLGLVQHVWIDIQPLAVAVRRLSSEKRGPRGEQVAVHDAPQHNQQSQQDPALQYSRGSKQPLIISICSEMNELRICVCVQFECCGLIEGYKDWGSSIPPSCNCQYPGKCVSISLYIPRTVNRSRAA